MTEENRRLVPEGGVVVDKYKLVDSNDVDTQTKTDHYLYSTRTSNPESESRGLLVEDCFKAHRVWSEIYAFKDEELICKMVLLIPLMPEVGFGGDKDFMFMQFAGSSQCEGTKEYAEALGYIREYLFLNHLVESLRVYTFADPSNKYACLRVRRSGLGTKRSKTVIKTDLTTGIQVIREIISKEDYINGKWKQCLTDWKPPSDGDITIPGRQT